MERPSKRVRDPNASDPTVMIVILVIGAFTVLCCWLFYDYYTKRGAHSHDLSSFTSHGGIDSRSNDAIMNGEISYPLCCPLVYHAGNPFADRPVRKIGEWSFVRDNYFSETLQSLPQLNAHAHPYTGAKKAKRERMKQGMMPAGE